MCTLERLYASINGLLETPFACTWRLGHASFLGGDSLCVGGRPLATPQLLYQYVAGQPKVLISKLVHRSVETQPVGLASSDYGQFGSNMD